MSGCQAVRAGAALAIAAAFSPSLLAWAATPVPYCASCAESGIASHAQAAGGGASTTTTGPAQAQDVGGGTSTASSAAATSVNATSADVLDAATVGGPVILATASTPLAPRSGPLCADFARMPQAGWAATSALQFPGPRGAIVMAVGQTVHPGEYLDGLDVGSILQRDCP